MQMPTPFLHESNDIITERYRIITTIGQGAFGTTYEAEDLTNYKRVALKVLSLRQTQDWKALDLFEREAKILASIDHPSIPRYFNSFYEDKSDDRLFYLVQELVEGESLSKLVKKGWRGNEEQVRDIALQVLKILDDLHQMQPCIIHRDIKPSNILRRADGKIYLVDFGAVKDAYRSTLIHGGTFIGTIGYMPPEQFRGKAFFASDLYALGATLLFLLTHRSPEDLPRKRMKFDFRDRVNISPDFANWLEKMLEPVVEDRYRSAREALGVLQNFQNREEIDRAHPKAIELSARKHHPPQGTSVTLTKNNDCLTIRFPTSLRTSRDGNLTGGCLVILSCLFFWSCLFIWSGIGWMLMVFVFFAFFALDSNFAQEPVVLKPDVLKIDRSRFSILRVSTDKPKIIEGKTAWIERACLSVITVPNSVESSKFILSVNYPSGKHNHYFGHSLTPAERQWLVEEISDFLRTIRSEEAKEAIDGESCQDTSD